MPLAWHPYLDPERVRIDLGHVARTDRVGHRVHVILAAAWCFLLPWPTTVVELAAVPLIAFALLRLPRAWRAWGSFIVQPAILSLLVFAAWMALSLVWSCNRHHGLDELATFRWLLIAWALWPVIAHRHAFTAALMAGFFCGNLSQALHAAGLALDLPALVWPRQEGRISGWWDPVVGGSLLVAALGLHLPTLVAPSQTSAAPLPLSPRPRLIAAIGVLATLAGILATGTRGAWLAAAALVVIAVPVEFFRARAGPETSSDGPPNGSLRPGTRALRPGTLAALATGATVVLLGGWMLRDVVVRRVDNAWRELREAVLHGRYDSDIGGRVLMAQLALDAVRTHQAAGVGAGCYRHWAQTRHESATSADAPPWHRGGFRERIHDHAHCAPLHIAATAGLIGLTLATLAGAFALAGALAGRSRLPAADAGPAWGLVGLMLAGATDAIHLNAQTAAMLSTLVALNLVSRPSPDTV